MLQLWKYVKGRRKILRSKDAQVFDLIQLLKTTFPPCSTATTNQQITADGTEFTGTHDQERT